LKLMPVIPARTGPFGVCLCLWLASPAYAQQADAAKLVGDVGLGVNAAPVAVRAQSSGSAAVPFLNLDYGPLFARIDTFGVKLAPFGAGSVELLTRVLSDGYTPRNGGQRRKDALPLGVGTLQVTSVGAFMANVYRDAGQSHGMLLDTMYAAELPLGPVTLYPQAGIERRSAAYVRWYAAPLRDGASNNTFAALYAEMPLAGQWHVNFNLRRTWLGRVMRDSPQVQRTTLDSGLLALSYRFN
jgi:outer membrane protein